MTETQLAALIEASDLADATDRLILADAYDEVGYDIDAALLRNLDRRAVLVDGELYDAGLRLSEEEIQDGLTAVREALEEYADDCSATYEHDEFSPWRLDDGGWSEYYRTVDDAVAASREYVVAMRLDIENALAMEEMDRREREAAQ